MVPAAINYYEMASLKIHQKGADLCEGNVRMPLAEGEELQGCSQEAVNGFVEAFAEGLVDAVSRFEIAKGAIFVLELDDYECESNEELFGGLEGLQSALAGKLADCVVQGSINFVPQIAVEVVFPTEDDLGYLDLGFTRTFSLVQPSQQASV